MTISNRARAAGLLSLTAAAAIALLGCQPDYDTKSVTFRGDYGTQIPTATPSPMVTVGPRPDVTATPTATPADDCSRGPRPGCP